MHYLKKTVSQSQWLKEQNFMFTRQLLYDDEYTEVLSYSCGEFVDAFMHHLFGNEQAFIQEEFNNSIEEVQKEINWLYLTYKKASKQTQKVCDQIFVDEPPQDLKKYIQRLEEALQTVIEQNQDLLKHLDNTPIYYLDKLYLLTGKNQEGETVCGEFVGNVIQDWSTEAQQHEFFSLPEPPEDYEGNRLEWIFKNNCLKVMEGSSLEYELQLDDNALQIKELLIEELPQEDQPENLLHHAWLITSQLLYEQFYDAYLYQLVICQWLNELLS